MNLISRKLARLEPYDPEIALGGIHMDANESFLSLPEPLCRAVADRVARIAFNRYPDPLAGEACKAFGAYYGVDARFVTAGNGSDELITILFNILLEKGDKALLVSPDFSMYPHYCALAEIEPVVLKKDADFRFDPDELVALAKKEQVRMVLFSNPCNPTSQALPAASVRKIIESLPECLVVVDEAYMDFWDEPIVREAPSWKNAVVLKTLSKVGLASIRLGFAVANDDLTGYLRAAKSPYNVNALTAAAAAAVLSEKESLRAATQKIRASRDALFEALEPLSADDFRVFPAHANFVTVTTPEADALHKTLRANGISVRCIGGKLLRITAGSPEENERLVKTLKDCRKEGAFK